MREANEQYAYFTLTGDFDPADLTRELGVAPSSSCSKGTPNKSGRRLYPFSRWSLDSRLDRRAPLEDHLLDVLAQLDAHAEAFARLVAARGGWVQLVGYFDAEGYPGLTFSAAIIRGLARFGLSVDCDFYGFDPPEGESGTPAS